MKRSSAGLMVAALALLGWPGVAGARGTTLFGATGPDATALQQWVAESHVPTPSVRVRLVLTPAGCEWHGADACATYGHPPTIYFMTGPYDLFARLDFYHEVAHVFDEYRMSPRSRRTFERLMHVHRDWNGGPDQPAEQFAQGYSYCAAGIARPPRGYYGFDYWPTAAQQRAVCRLIDSVR